MNIVEKAIAFARTAHAGQVRKYTGEPYWMHLFSVATRLDHCGLRLVENMDEVEAIAWLHDILEDTDTTSTDLAVAGFPPYVIQRVLELTDVYTKEAYPHLNRAQRKLKEAERMAKAHPLTRIVKMADLIDNAISIMVHDKDFAKTFLLEVQMYLDTAFPDAGAFHFSEHDSLRYTLSRLVSLGATL